MSGYIVDGIAYAGEAAPALKVRSVQPLADHFLKVSFTNGETKRVDFKPLLTLPAFAPLADESLFNAVYVDYGCPVWDDGHIDIAPEYLYQNGVAM